MSRYRDPRNPDMSPEEKAAFDTWWRGITMQGDPSHRPWLVREAFHAAWESRPSSDLLGALKDLLSDCIEYARINNLSGQDGKPATNHAMRRAQAAIEKAEGLVAGRGTGASVSEPDSYGAR